jgi:hypothetical protein
MNLVPADLASFEQLGIDADLLAAAHVTRVTDREAKDAFGIQYSGDKAGVVFPYYINDRRVTARLRRDNPEVDIEGRPQNKYVAAWGDTRHCYFPPEFLATLKRDPDVALVAVEAEKSALAGTAWAKRTGKKFIFFALGGCWGWRGRIGKTEAPDGTRIDVKGALPDLAVCDGRTVHVMLDANVATNEKVLSAEKALVAELRKRNCRVLTCRIPTMKMVNGPDDLIRVAGDDGLARVLQSGGESLARPSRARIVRLADVKAKKVQWLWQDRLPLGMLAMFSGDSGGGKTTVALSLSAGLTVGRLPGGEHCEPINVLYFSNENPAEYVLRPRFEKLDGDLERFYHCQGSEWTDANGETHAGGITFADVAMLDEALAETQAKLVIVDPIQSYLPSKTDAHRANEVRALLDPLAKLAEKHHCCILLIRHLNKGSGGRAIYRGQMSIDFTAAVRSELLVGSFEGNRAVVHILSNVGPVAPSVGFSINEAGEFGWTGKSDITAEQMLADPTQETDEASGKVKEAVEWLKDFLTPDSQAGTDCIGQARKNGISERTLWRAKAMLSVKATKAGFKGGFIWSLPEECPSPTEVGRVGRLGSKSNKTQDLVPANDLAGLADLADLEPCQRDLAGFDENTNPAKKSAKGLAGFDKYNNNKDLSIDYSVTKVEACQLPGTLRAREERIPNGFDPVS